MIAILGGLGAAACWAAATVCSSRSSRMIGAASVLAWVMLVGLVVSAPAVVFSGVPRGIDSRSVGWLSLAGTGNVVGLLLEYRALRIGKVGIVAPIASTEGAIAAVLAVIAGERVAPGTGMLLGVIAVGVVLAGLVPEADRGLTERHEGEATLYAAGAALSFGVSLYAAGRVSQELPLVWVVLPARVVGVVALTLPLALGSRLRLTGRAVPLVVTSGLCEVGGFVLFGVGARHGIAITAVLGSQFAALSALVAYAFFRERLAKLQVAGVAAILVGVAILSGLQA